MNTTNRNIRKSFNNEIILTATLTLLISQHAVAEGAVDSVPPPTPAQAATATQVPDQSPAQALAQTPPPTPEPTKIKTASIGLDYLIENSVPGQESIQKNVPIGISYETDSYVMEFSIPYIQRSAPSGKIASSEHHESKKKTGTIAPIVTTSGMGDLTSSLQYKILNQQTSPLSLSAKGTVKFATATLASGLGTGVNDYSVEAKASKSHGDITYSASIGYAFLGSPGDVEINDVKQSIFFRNIVFGSLGSAYQFRENLNADLRLDMGQATEAGGYQQRDISTSMEYKFSTSQAIHIKLLKSVTPGISLWGASASISTAF